MCLQLGIEHLDVFNTEGAREPVSFIFHKNRKIFLKNFKFDFHFVRICTTIDLQKKRFSLLKT